MAPNKIAVAGATGRVGRQLVEVLTERGHEVVPMSRATGVDLLTGDGLDEALTGVDCIVDAASGPSADEQEATEFFTTATRNLHEAGERAGVRQMVVVSIIGIDQATGGYSAAKLVHERAHLDGPIPARILRAAQFHEFVGQLVDWGRQGDVAYVYKMRTQLVAARTVAEALADLATDATDAAGGNVPAQTEPATPFPEIAGPREESLVEAARLLVARRGDDVDVVEVSDPANPDRELQESGALLPGPHATLAGPTFEAWLSETMP
jgi:uncharacterized protein YbjT (DUF2867 family)